MKLSTRGLVGATIVVAAGLCSPSWAQEPEKPVRDASYMTHLRDEGFPLNVNPKIIKPEESPLQDDDLIMGVVVDGVARAYPVNYMNGPYNEVVNDQIGETPIAPTW